MYNTSRLSPYTPHTTLYYTALTSSPQAVAGTAELLCINLPLLLLWTNVSLLILCINLPLPLLWINLPLLILCINLSLLVLLDRIRAVHGRVPASCVAWIHVYIIAREVPVTVTVGLLLYAGRNYQCTECTIQWHYVESGAMRLATIRIGGALVTAELCKYTLTFFIGIVALPKRGPNYLIYKVVRGPTCSTSQLILVQ